MPPITLVTMPISHKINHVVCASADEFVSGSFETATTTTNDAASVPTAAMPIAIPSAENRSLLRRYGREVVESCNTVPLSETAVDHAWPSQ